MFYTNDKTVKLEKYVAIKKKIVYILAIQIIIPNDSTGGVAWLPELLQQFQLF
jgi:hypothetical protein